jgi:hypothetical protein
MTQKERAAPAYTYHSYSSYAQFSAAAPGQTHGSHEDPVPRLWWQRSWSPLWVIGAVAYLGLAEKGYKPAAFCLRALFALKFVLNCASNLFHTPSHGETNRTTHRRNGCHAMSSEWSVCRFLGLLYGLSQRLRIFTVPRGTKYPCWNGRFAAWGAIYQVLFDSIRQIGLVSYD